MLRALILAIFTVVAISSAAAFQLAPMGSDFEARLTRETNSTLSRVAGRVGDYATRL